MPEVQKSLLEQTTTKEEWRTCREFPDYEVSNLGRLRHTLYLTPQVDNDGYLYVRFYRDSIAHNRRLHLVVASAFLPNPDHLAEVNHEDGNRQNARLDNLKRMSQIDNQRHSWRRGARIATHPRGEKHGMSKLTAPQVICIRHFCGIWRQRSIARHFGISQHTVTMLRRGFIWKHVPGAASSTRTTIRTHQRGSTNGGAKLTEVQVREIRSLAASVSGRQLGKMYGVSQGLISAILLGKRWKHIAIPTESD